MATPTTLPAAFVAGAVLTADQMNNLRGAFRVLQVLSTSTTTETSTTSTTFADVTNLTLTITPQATTSKILVMSSTFYYATGALQGSIRYLRGATNIYSSVLGVFPTTTGFSLSSTYLDSPATVAATTYKVQFAKDSGAGTLFVNPSAISSSTLTLMEISA
jgi:hypothetical protein